MTNRYMELADRLEADASAVIAASGMRDDLLRLSVEIGDTALQRELHEMEITAGSAGECLLRLREIRHLIFTGIGR